MSSRSQRILEEGRPNAGPELLPEAGATQERTLEAVRCSALFGQAVALFEESTLLRPRFSSSRHLCRWVIRDGCGQPLDQGKAVEVAHGAQSPE